MNLCHSVIQRSRLLPVSQLMLLYPLALEYSVSSRQNEKRNSGMEFLPPNLLDSDGVQIDPCKYIDLNKSQYPSRLSQSGKHEPWICHCSSTRNVSNERRSFRTDFWFLWQYRYLKNQ